MSTNSHRRASGSQNIVGILWVNSRHMACSEPRGHWACPTLIVRFKPKWSVSSGQTFVFSPQNHQHNHHRVQTKFQHILGNAQINARIHHKKLNWNLDYIKSINLLKIKWKHWTGMKNFAMPTFAIIPNKCRGLCHCQSWKKKLNLSLDIYRFLKNILK